MPAATMLLVLAVLVGLYMAWNIGANDVANAMGTSVGSGALSVRNAILVAGVLEFAGAVLVGAYVTDTVRKGIVDPRVFSSDPQSLVHGMIAALLSAALWLNLSSHLGWPVSTTHSIVGAIAGFGILAGGSDAISWMKLATIVSSWIVSPLVGGGVAYTLYAVVRRKIVETDRPAYHAKRFQPALSALLAFVLSLVTLFKGLKNLHLDLSWIQTISIGLGISVAVGMLVRSLGSRATQSDVGEASGGIEAMERVFIPLQVATAAAVAFAHGANDVANAVGPLAAVLATLKSGEVSHAVGVPMWVLMLGGIGIVIGLATYGFRVMSTVGKKITEMTPTRGYCAEFGAAITILGGSKLGLPLSTTHTLVGAVIGVGLSRGRDTLNLRVVRSILASWFLTVPVAALTCVPLFYLVRLVARL